MCYFIIIQAGYSLQMSKSNVVDVVLVSLLVTFNRFDLLLFPLFTLNKLTLGDMLKQRPHKINVQVLKPLEEN